LGDACVGDPDVREDYDLGEKIVRLQDPMSRGVCFPTIVRFVSSLQGCGKYSGATEVIRSSVVRDSSEDGGGVLGLGGSV
jgi:hypothetical protein